MNTILDLGAIVAGVLTVGLLVSGFILGLTDD